eukprot:1193306-Prorocentrum_minimum.AAC.1
MPLTLARLDPPLRDPTPVYVSYARAIGSSFPIYASYARAIGSSSPGPDPGVCLFRSRGWILLSGICLFRSRDWILLSGTRPRYMPLSLARLDPPLWELMRVLAVPSATGFCPGRSQAPSPRAIRSQPRNIPALLAQYGQVLGTGPSVETHGA